MSHRRVDILVRFFALFLALSQCEAIPRARGYWGVKLRGGNSESIISIGSTAPSVIHTSDGAQQPEVPPGHDNAALLPPTLASWRRKLPVKLQKKGPKTLQKIQLHNTDVYLLGTAHISNDSSADVQILLDAIKPDCIFVELCESRIPLLESSTNNTDANATKLSFLERVKETQQAQGGGRMQALSTVLLTGVQEDYARELGVELGGEFRRAHAYWLTSNYDFSAGARIGRRPHLVLGDRPLHLTLYRAWESLSRWSKIKVMLGLLWSTVQKPNPADIRAWLASVMREESDILTESFEEMRTRFPTLYTTIISERDAWLAAKIVQTCFTLSRRQYPTTKNDENRRVSMVAIVGAGHMPGICQWLTASNTTSPEQVLATLVDTKRWAKDEYVQREAIPMWINEVTELHENLE